MAVEVGNIVEGKVTGITDFGAFVELPEGKSGMVHISEVAPTYVNKITDFLQEGQTVKVKILNINEENGKIGLSIRKAMDNGDRKNKRSNKDNKNQNNNRPFRKNSGYGDKSSVNKTTQSSVQVTGPGNFEWQSSKKTEAGNFEELMSSFKKSSEEKFSDLKKNTDISRRPRRNPKQ